MMRAFIAIELGKDLQKQLDCLQDKLKISSPDVKWVKHENIHLTLKFLGPTEEEKIQPVQTILDKIALRFEVFDLEISNLGIFPNSRSPRVIWVGAIRKIGF
jgi:RNA 2',3'-cyclic 3'-phosphodiesterase